MDVTSGMIKELREKTGAGIMECKSVLTEAQGDATRAEELLRKRGQAKMEKRAGREAKQGLIESYVHGGRLGAILELNCETDFVGRTTEFQELAHDLALHIAAMNPLYIDRTSIDPEVMATKRAEFEADARSEGKPERILDQIVSGKIDKFVQEVCLLDQAWVKDPERKIGDLISAYAAKTGENIRVGRFARYALGE